MLTDRSLIIALCVASGFFFLVLLLPLLRGETFVAGDLLAQSFPFRKFYADRLHAHESFLWSPYIYGGFYLHGEGQAGMMHPFHLILYFLTPVTTAFSIEILSIYAFLFGGCYLLFRCWKLGIPAALFGSYLFTFGGTNLILLEHINAIAVMAHLPWVLLAIHRVFEAKMPRSRALWICAVALLTGSQVLLGHPQSVYFCSLVEGSYAVFLMLDGTRWRRLLEVAAALVIGLLIGGVQLLPTMTATLDSARSKPPLEFLSEISLQPQELVQWMNPLLWQGYRFDQFRAFYNLFIYCGGTVTLLLFVWILTRKELSQPRRKLALYLGIVAAAGLFLALGKYNLVFPLYARLPILGLFRAPARYMVLTDFAIAAGAALALDQLRAGEGQLSLSAFVKAVAGFFLLASLLTIPVALLPAVSGLGPHLASPVKAAGGALIVAAGAILFLVSAKVPRVAGSWLAVFVLLEVLCVQGTVLLVHNKTGDPFLLTSPPPIDAPGPVEARSGDQLTLLDYKLVDGYSGLEPSSPVPFGTYQYARLSGARALWSGGWRPVPDPLPLLRLRNRAVLMENREALLNDSNLLAQAALMDHPSVPPLLQEHLAQVNGFDFSNSALVEMPLSLDSSATGSLRAIEEHPDRMVVEANTTGKMLGTLGIRFHPGWKVFMDGRPHQTIRVDGSLLGFVVPAGRHIIECRFDPNDFRQGELASIAGVGGLLLYLALVFIVNRRKEGRADGHI
ncbi:MAG TPA: hypothetical protein VG273_15235 [Bryobacteraceae bacterium]|jgi:hypothetical protein|nr:hypothetical protein [Bryobacteraceae bacterium]